MSQETFDKLNDAIKAKEYLVKTLEEQIVLLKNLIKTQEEMIKVREVQLSMAEKTIDLLVEISK
jgi:hypothetical protein